MARQCGIVIRSRTRAVFQNLKKPSVRQVDFSPNHLPEYPASRILGDAVGRLIEPLEENGTQTTQEERITT